MTEASELTFEVTPGTNPLSALLLRPTGAQALLVLAHGAGAGMRHLFMEAVAYRLAARRIATFRYQFPYMEEGRSRPDPAPKLEATVRSALAAAVEACPRLPVFAGGKSMGGRMTSQAAAREALPGVRGLLFFGFPLHAAGQEGVARGEHLLEVPHPMLFLQGTRDQLANLELLHPLLAELVERATLHAILGGDHSFKMLKGSGRTDAEALDEVADAAATWMKQRV
jgi:uncharacterized protein